jgi:hypothetical protein
MTGSNRAGRACKSTSMVSATAEPTTFRLRVGPKPSNWTRPGPSWLLRCGTEFHPVPNFIQYRPVVPRISAWVAKEVATPSSAGSSLLALAVP